MEYYEQLLKGCCSNNDQPVRIMMALLCKLQGLSSPTEVGNLDT
jgi:hypothetical protein